MKRHARLLLMLALMISSIWAVAYARELGSREAREKIALALGLESRDQVRIKNITPGMSGDAVVEAAIDTAVRFTKDKSGNWQAVEIRAGDRRWESIELLRAAINKEKSLRTAADMQTIATALESFRRERGFYVVAESGAALIDNLMPTYLRSVIRLDAWSREFNYKGEAASYRLTSAGADGKAGTSDDIVVENGQAVKGTTD
jgi:hypothetical protein